MEKENKQPKKIKNDSVKLIATDVKDPKQVDFSIDQANKLLKLPKSQWKLDDDKWQWNGVELAKK